MLKQFWEELVRERYSRSGDNAKMKAFTFARNEEDLTDNSRTPTGTKIYFRSPSPSQNSLVLKFPNITEPQTQEEQTQQRWNFEAIWASVFKKERKSGYKSNFRCVSLRRQVCLWICRAMFLQRVFQFDFLNTVETLSFFGLKSSSEFVLHCEKFISLLASPPTYRSKFQLCTIACVAGVWKRREVEFKAGEKREGSGARGGREGNAFQETIVFAIPPNNYLCKYNATVNDLAFK